MAIEVIKLDAMPSVGMLTHQNTSWSSYDRMEERDEYLRNAFAPLGGNSYFGTANDKYYQAFQNTIMQHVETGQRALRRIRDAMAVMSTEDVIRPCTAELSLRNLPPKMYLPILSLPDLYHLFRLQRVQGWGELTPADVQPYVEVYNRLIDKNGTAKLWFEEKSKTEPYVVWKYCTGDPNLTAQQIFDIKRTRDYVQDILDNTDLDPTDLDTARS